VAASFTQQVVCPVLIGRALQRDALHELIERVSEGPGQTLLIAGEAGIGKSRLVAEAKASLAARGFRLLEGACFPQDSACPYTPLLEMLRGHLSGRSPDEVAAAVGPYARDICALLPEHMPLVSTDVSPAPPSLDPAQQQRRLFGALAHCLTGRATAQPLAIIVEDLHWSDESSLDFLLYLLRRSTNEPMLLIGTYRSDEVGPQLRHWLAQLDRTRLSHELPLAPLNRDEVAAMLGATFALERPVRAEFLDAIYMLTEGNPFYVEELLKSLVAAGDIFYADGNWGRKSLEELHIPRSLHDAVQQRVTRLSDDARRVVALAAAVGRRFDFALLQQLANLGESDLLRLIKELIAAQLVVEESAERFAFRHALTRQAIYAQLLARERAALHRTIAETIEQMYADALEAYTPDLAYHFFEAGVWEAALGYARRAGERAHALGAPHAANKQFARALASASKLATPDQSLFLARGRAYETIGDFACARDDYELGLHLARAAQDGAGEWHSLLALGRLWASRDYQQAGEWFRRALDLAQRLGDPYMLARSMNRLGNWHVNTGEASEGLRLHEQALALFEAQGDRQRMADTLDLLGMANGLYGDMISSVQHFGRAIDIYRALGDSAGLSSALASRACFSGGVCGGPVVGAYRSYADCAADLAESLQLARQIDWPAGQAYAEYTAGRVFDIFGDFGTALAHARAALQLAASIEHRQWIAATHWAMGRNFVGLLLPDQAIENLLAGIALAHALGSEVFVGEITSTLAMAYVLDRDLLQAEMALAAVLPRDQSPRNLVERKMALAWGELALARGAPEQALAMAEQLLASAPGSVRGPIPALLKLQGESLLALGRAGEAAPILELARREAKTHELCPLLWQILRALGQAHQRLGNKQAAQDAYATARAVIEKLAATLDDAELHTQFVRAALATLPSEKPLTARRAEAERFGGLTARERDVARLIGQGSSNREMADALVISEKTVETHVSNILSKLGHTSRVQIAAWAFAAGLLGDPE
jgi:DNA-binding NarL/FixJ family response regulator